MDLRRHTTGVMYICWKCDEDFELTGQADRPEVTCPDCGRDLVAVNSAAIRYGATDRRHRESAVRGTDCESRIGGPRKRV